MTEKQKQEARRILSERQLAYKRVFGNDDPENPDPSKAMVLADLGRFCREFETTFHQDPRVHAALEGRREVVLRIRDYLVLSLDELLKKYGGQ